MRARRCSGSCKAIRCVCTFMRRKRTRLLFAKDWRRKFWCRNFQGRISTAGSHAPQARCIRNHLEVLDGLAEKTRVVMNPTDDLAEGIQVQLTPAEKPKGDANAKQSSSGQ